MWEGYEPSLKSLLPGNRTCGPGLGLGVRAEVEFMSIYITFLFYKMGLLTPSHQGMLRIKGHNRGESFLLCFNRIFILSFTSAGIFFTSFLNLRFTIPSVLVWTIWKLSKWKASKHFSNEGNPQPQLALTPQEPRRRRAKHRRQSISPALGAPGAAASVPWGAPLVSTAAPPRAEPAFPSQVALSPGNVT